MLLFSGAALLACACTACGSELESPGALRPAQARAAPTAADERAALLGRASALLDGAARGAR
jgi:hypothetical protein